MAKQPKNNTDGLAPFLRRLAQPGIDVGVLQIRRRKGRRLKRTPADKVAWGRKWNRIRAARRKAAARAASAERYKAQAGKSKWRFSLDRCARRTAGGRGKPPTPIALPLGVTQLGALLRAMQPGVWYSARELATALGLAATRAVNPALMQKALPAGYVEKARNADWDPVLHRSYNGLAPRFLWRLTDAGVKARVEACITE